jgi:hypothetical protein
MFSLFKIVFLLASFLPLIFADTGCLSGENNNKPDFDSIDYISPCCNTTYIDNDGNTNLSNVTKIGDYLFYNCKSLKSVTFGRNLTSIGVGAFAYTGITNLYLPDSLKTIGEGAFDACDSLISVSFGKNLTSIGNNAFQSTGITNLYLPNSLQTISYKAFFSCESLTSVSFGRNLTYIGYRAFESTGITNLDLPDSLQTIDEKAFFSCKSLTSVSFGQNLTSIGDYAFDSTGIRNVSMPMSLYDKFNTNIDPNTYALSFTVDKTYSKNVDKSIRLESYNETITNIYNCANPWAPSIILITSNCEYSKTIYNNQPTLAPTNQPTPTKPYLSILEIVLIVIFSLILVGGIIGTVFLIKNKCFNCNKNMAFTKQVDNINTVV